MGFEYWFIYDNSTTWTSNGRRWTFSSNQWDWLNSRPPRRPKRGIYSQEQLEPFSNLRSCNKLVTCSYWIMKAGRFTCQLIYHIYIYFSCKFAYIHIWMPTFKGAHIHVYLHYAWLMELHCARVRVHVRLHMHVHKHRHELLLIYTRGGMSAWD